ncbi:hypothetical protein [Methylobacterium planeticum]|uniref:Uncharacterized protein n=1 Tax=Methylobacterium planeticum TaxID=2615211 RepID=A0A6N6MGP1_9HYPH|nr:hypothetical protein [Methylobacterium planeticum]KAB1070099.1 hypothetical protein F6X51_23765 [Methylobacterium planeticum]
MSFLLRAALVIGALSYLAAQRGVPGIATPPSPDAAAAAVPAAIGLPTAAAVLGGLPAALPAVLPAVLGSLPPEARERLAREGLAELSRRVGAAPASRDTLAAADRSPPWRGVEPR